MSEGLVDAAIGALAIAPFNPQILYAGGGHPEPRYDIAAGNGMYRSDDGGAHWHFARLAATRHIGAIVVDPNDRRRQDVDQNAVRRQRHRRRRSRRRTGASQSRIVYGSGLGGHLSRWDARTGEVQNVSPWPVSSYGVIYNIAPSPLDHDEIWIGTDNGRAQLTRDGGQRWKDITPKGVPDWAGIATLDVSALPPVRPTRPSTTIGATISVRASCARATTASLGRLFQMAFQTAISSM